MTNLAEKSGNPAVISLNATDLAEEALVLSDHLEASGYAVLQFDLHAAGDVAEFEDSPNILCSNMSYDAVRRLYAACIRQADDLFGTRIALDFPWIAAKPDLAWINAPDFHEWDVGSFETLALFRPGAGGSVVAFVIDGVEWDFGSEFYRLFHSRGLELLRRHFSGQIHEQESNLSTNERLCLVWSACGKTSSEIAVILELSEHTVNHYFIIAANKLGANNRAQAVARAIKLGIIQMDEIH